MSDLDKQIEELKADIAYKSRLLDYIFKKYGTPDGLDKEIAELTRILKLMENARVQQ